MQDSLRKVGDLPWDSLLLGDPFSLLKVFQKIVPPQDKCKHVKRPRFFAPCLYQVNWCRTAGILQGEPGRGLMLLSKKCEHPSVMANEPVNSAKG